MSNPDDLQKLKKFLKRAAEGKLPPDYHGKKRPDDPDLVDLDEAFKRAREKAQIDLDEGKRWEPSPELCQALLTQLDGWSGGHGIVTGSPPFDQMYLLVRFAMPLLPTVESEDGAAG
jgi:hypothetical protein